MSLPFSHIFTLPLNERFTFALKTTLHKDGTPDTGEYEQASLLVTYNVKITVGSPEQLPN